MLLDDYAHKVHSQLIDAAALGDERTQQIARALAAMAESSIRLAILDALSAAAAEITAALLDGAGGQPSASVSMQLDGDELRVVVTSAPAEPVEPRSDEGEATARISLRLSEALKADIEQAAATSDISVNTWLVRAANSSLRSGAGNHWPPAADWARAPHSRHATRVTGWVTG